jgi:hypothetical protein
MIFGLVLKLEISYRVIISWRILVSFRRYFEDYIFAWWNIWVFIFFCLKIPFNVNGKATVWHTPCSCTERRWKRRGGHDAPPWFSDFVLARKERERGGGGRVAMVLLWFSGFVLARKGGWRGKGWEGGGLRCPSLVLRFCTCKKRRGIMMPPPFGFLVLYLQEKEEEDLQCPSLVLWFCTCKKRRRRKGPAMPLPCFVATGDKWRQGGCVVLPTFFCCMNITKHKGTCCPELLLPLWGEDK